MLVNMSSGATRQEIDHVIERIKECGFQAHVIEGAERTVIGAVGSSGRRSEIEALRAAPGVEAVIQIATPFKLVSRQLRQTRTVVDVSGVRIGAEDLVVMAGPCCRVERAVVGNGTSCQSFRGSTASWRRL